MKEVELGGIDAVSMEMVLDCTTIYMYKSGFQSVFPPFAIVKCRNAVCNSLVSNAMSAFFIYESRNCGLFMAKYQVRN